MDFREFQFAIRMSDIIVSALTTAAETRSPTTSAEEMYNMEMGSLQQSAKANTNLYTLHKQGSALFWYTYNLLNIHTTGNSTTAIPDSEKELVKLSYVNWENSTKRKYGVGDNFGVFRCI